MRSGFLEPSSTLRSHVLTTRRRTCRMHLMRKRPPTRLCSGRTWLRSVLLGSRKPDRMTPSRLCTSAPTYLTCSPRFASQRQSKRYFPWSRRPLQRSAWVDQWPSQVWRFCGACTLYSALLATGTTRLSAADNDCTRCSLFGCKAGNDIKKCPIMNKAVPTGPGTAFPRDAQVRYIDGGRNKLAEEPDLTTLKDVKFFVKPSEFSSGKGKGGPGGGLGGGRGGAPYGRGAGRGGQVTSIFSGNDDMNHCKMPLPSR